MIFTPCVPLEERKQPEILILLVVIHEVASSLAKEPLCVSVRVDARARGERPSPDAGRRNREGVVPVPGGLQPLERFQGIDLNVFCWSGLPRGLTSSVAYFLVRERGRTASRAAGFLVGAGERSVPGAGNGAVDAHGENK